MTAPANATIRQLWARIWRIRLARWAMRASRAPNDPDEMSGCGDMEGVIEQHGFGIE